VVRHGSGAPDAGGVCLPRVARRFASLPAEPDGGEGQPTDEKHDQGRRRSSLSNESAMENMGLRSEATHGRDLISRRVTG
jgi:hypothetical protein